MQWPDGTHYVGSDRSLTGVIGIVEGHSRAWCAGRDAGYWAGCLRPHALPVDLGDEAPRSACALGRSNPSVRASMAVAGGEAAAVSRAAVMMALRRMGVEWAMDRSSRRRGGARLRAKATGNPPN
jgi:hypothetical protein